MINKFPYLTLFYRFNDQSHLFPGLIEPITVQIGNPDVRAQNRLNRAEVIFSRFFLVIDKGLRQDRLFCVDGQYVDIELGPVGLLKYAIHSIDL